MDNGNVTSIDAGVKVPDDIQSETVNYRVVADDEMAFLKPLFDRMNWSMPDSDKSKIVVAEAGLGKDAIILGFVVVQFVPHTEPMWVHPSMRGSGVAQGLMETVVHYVEQDCHITRYVATAKPGSFAARLCEQNGMVPYPGQIYVKHIEKQGG